MAAEKTASSARHSGAVFAAAALVLLLLPGDGSGSGSGGGGVGGAGKDKIRSVTLPGDVILGESPFCAYYSFGDRFPVTLVDLYKVLLASEKLGKV